MDRKGQWLYLTAVQSQAIYRLPGALLRSADLTDEKLAKALERYADKPACASLAIDNKNNLYIGDIQARAIGVIEPEKRSYKLLTSDPRLVWPDGLCFGQDGKLYFYSRTQATVSASPTQDGRPAATEHSMFRLQPLAPGQPGN
jgi:sugar lactone lactonase YvrE